MGKVLKGEDFKLKIGGREITSMTEDSDLLQEFERMLDDTDTKTVNRKLRTGDYVEHVCDHGRFKARVIRALDDGRVRIQYDNKDLIPPKDTVPAEQLEWQTVNGERVKYVNPMTACPECDEAWTVTKGFHLDEYYDCLKCGAKREDYVNE